MRKKRKLSKFAPSKDASAAECLPEYLHVALFKEEEECECKACSGKYENAICKTSTKYKFFPEVVKDVSYSEMGTIIGGYRLESTHKVEVMLVDVDKKGNKQRR